MAHRVLRAIREALHSSGAAVLLCIALGALSPGDVAAQLKVREVRFDGNEAFSDRQLRAVTNIENRSWLGLSKPRFNYLIAGRDAAFLRAWYHNRGFLEATATHTTEVVDGEQLLVIYTITEGPHTALDEVLFRGNTLFADDELMAEIGRRRETRLRTGRDDPLNTSAIQNAALAIRQLYRDSGHYFVGIQPGIADRDSLRGSADVYFELTEGPEVRVQRVQIDGARDTKGFVITREVTLNTGDLLTERERRESQRRLFNTGIFRGVNVTVGEVSEDSTSATVLVTVSERPRRYIDLGGGFARDEQAQTDLSLRTTGKWGHRNLYGTGRAIELSAAGTFQVVTGWQPIQQELSLQYLEPWFFGERMPATLLMAYRPQQYEVYETQEFAVEVGLRREFTEYLTGWFNFNYRLVDASVPIEELSTQQALRGVNGELVRDTRDVLFSPSRGSLTRFRAKNYGWLFGGPDYDHFTFEWSRYVPTGRRTIFGVRAKVGMVSPRGETGDIPIFDRFFAGGASTVRGYDEGALGPVAERTRTDGSTAIERVGGRVLALLNVEARRPGIAGPIGIHYFVDAGNVWARGSEVELRFAASAGAGLFLDSPLGPLRFDYAWRLNRSDAELALPGYRLPAQRFHFSILHAF